MPVCLLGWLESATVSGYPVTSHWFWLLSFSWICDTHDSCFQIVVMKNPKIFFYNHMVTELPPSFYIQPNKSIFELCHFCFLMWKIQKSLKVWTNWIANNNWIIPWADWGLTRTTLFPSLNSPRVFHRTREKSWTQSLTTVERPFFLFHEGGQRKAESRFYRYFTFEVIITLSIILSLNLE